MKKKSEANEEERGVSRAEFQEIDACAPYAKSPARSSHNYEEDAGRAHWEGRFINRNAELGEVATAGARQKYRNTVRR